VESGHQASDLGDGLKLTVAEHHRDPCAFDDQG
jgi:hypothetical protein